VNPGPANATLFGWVHTIELGIQSADLLSAADANERVPLLRLVKPRTAE
jgi:hypothetical protein